MDLEMSCKPLAEKLFNYLHPYCIAIYLGGSICEGIIKNPHDIDFIFFVDQNINKCHIRRLLHHFQQENNIPLNCDFVQLRNIHQEEHSYGSYIHKKMIKLAGADVLFDFDVICKHRQEYKNILISTINKLDTNVIWNQKRWYQIIRGFYILKHNNYELSEQEKEIINIVHDQLPGWEQYKITVNDVLKY